MLNTDCPPPRILHYTQSFPLVGLQPHKHIYIERACIWLYMYVFYIYIYMLCVYTPISYTTHAHIFGILEELYSSYNFWTHTHTLEIRTECQKPWRCLSKQKGLNRPLQDVSKGTKRRVFQSNSRAKIEGGVQVGSADSPPTARPHQTWKPSRL